MGGVGLTGDKDTPAYALTDKSGKVTTTGATADNYNIMWDGETLTLNNAVITQGSHENAAIYCGEDAGIHLVLVGESTVTGPSGVDASRGIYTRGELTISGSGSLMELSQKQFFGMAGVEATGISYDGSSPTIAALLGGHIDVCTGHPGEVMQYVESGDAVAIGIFNDERDPRENLKDIPTFKEMGYDVTMSVWKFLMLPAGTPEDVVTKVTETLTAITGTDEYKEFCDANQLLPLTLTTEEMVERINEEAAVNQELLAG